MEIENKELGFESSLGAIGDVIRQCVKSKDIQMLKKHIQISKSQMI